MHVPVVPSIVSRSPLRSTVPVRRKVSVSFLASTSISAQPETQGFPMPRATTAAWLFRSVWVGGWVGEWVGRKDE